MQDSDPETIVPITHLLGGIVHLILPASSDSESFCTTEQVFARAVWSSAMSSAGRKPFFSAWSSKVVRQVGMTRGVLVVPWMSSDRMCGDCDIGCDENDQATPHLVVRPCRNLVVLTVETFATSSKWSIFIKVCFLPHIVVYQCTRSFIASDRRVTAEWKPPLHLDNTSHQECPQN